MANKAGGGGRWATKAAQGNKLPMGTYHGTGGVALLSPGRHDLADTVVA